MEYLRHASFGIGVLGGLVIVFGVIGGLLRFLRAEFLSLRGHSIEEDRKYLRRMLGYYLLLGMEFLIAADIIETLVKPSVQELIVLGAIVLIRTIISYSLNDELKSEKPVLAPILTRRMGDAYRGRRRKEADHLTAHVNPPPYVGGYTGEV